MLDLTISQLADDVDGHLTMGVLPPRDGDLETVGRLVTRVEQIQPGDLYWALEQQPDQQLGACLEANLRDAQGTVVGGTHWEPWAGRYTISVADSRAALQQLARQQRARFQGTVIGVIGPDTAATTACQIQTALQYSGSSATTCDVLRDVEEAALAVAQWPAHSQHAVVHYGPLDGSNFLEISHLCRPDIIAINSLAFSDHCLRDNQRLRDNQHVNGNRSTPAQVLIRFLETLPPHATVVMDGNYAWLKGALPTIAATILTVGRDGRMEVVTPNVSCHQGRLALDVEYVQNRKSPRASLRSASSTTGVGAGVSAFDSTSNPVRGRS